MTHQLALAPVSRRVVLSFGVLAASGALAYADAPTVEFVGERFVKKFDSAKNRADKFTEFGLEIESIDRWTKLFVFHSYPQGGNDPMRATGNL